MQDAPEWTNEWNYDEWMNEIMMNEWMELWMNEIMNEHETQMRSGRNYAHAQYALIIAEFPRKLHFQSRLLLAPSKTNH